MSFDVTSLAIGLIIGFFIWPIFSLLAEQLIKKYKIKM
jgi:hypothetical protein